MVHSGLQFFYCEQPYFHVGMGSERHNVAYCDFRSTFFLDEFAFKNHL